MVDKKKVLDERGSSLIIVIIGAAFLGILGALILSITFTNINLKTTNNASKKNFYVEEVAVNEITAKLEELSADSLSDAYVWLVKNCKSQGIDMNDNYDILKKKYMTILSQKLNHMSSVTDDLQDTYKIDILQDAIQSFSKSEADLEHVSVKVYNAGPTDLMSGTLVSPKDAADQYTYEYMTLKNVYISYTDISGYETSIVTDINIQLPFSDKVDTTFAKFALISDQLIDCTNRVNVTGGVYAGTLAANKSVGEGGDATNPNSGGIWVHGLNGELTIDAKNNLVATRENMTASNSGILKVLDAKVWANNIMTFGDNVRTDRLSTVDINAITKVKDDLILKADNSNVVLNGKYYGFSYKSKDDAGKISSNTSSAITVNAKHVSLDMSGLSTTALFGRAFISSSAGKGNSNREEELTSDTLMDIMTGQSIALKNDQTAYLVPKEDYLKLSMNPIEISALRTYAEGKLPAGSYDPEAPYLSLNMETDIVDFSKSKAAAIRPYLDAVKPIRAIYYKQGTGVHAQKMANFYFNFKDEKSANEYFEKYYSIDKNKQSLISTYKKYYRFEGSQFMLKLNPTSERFQFAGDVLYQKPSDGTFTIEKGDTSDMEAESKQYSDEYSSVQLNLYETGDNTKDVATNPYVDKHFDLSHISTCCSPADVLPLDTTCRNAAGQLAKVYITNKDNYTVPPNTVGLVIASKNVTVAGNFEGLIVADGEITLGNSANINANESLILDILDYCYHNGNILKDYVYGYSTLKDMTAGSSAMDFGSAISFENWRKNI